MTVGLRLWEDSGSAPGSWTDYTALTCWAREAEQIYDSETALDGTKESWSRTYLKVSITFGAPQLLDGTIRATLLTVIGSKNYRVKDVRHASLGDANTIRFVKDGDVEITRDAETNVAQFVTLNLISATVI